MRINGLLLVRFRASCHAGAADPSNDSLAFFQQQFRCVSKTKFESMRVCAGPSLLLRLPVWREAAACRQQHH